MLDLDAIDRAMPPARSGGMYVRPSHIAIAYGELATLLALARAGRKLAEAAKAYVGPGKSLEVDWDASAKGPYFTVKAVDKTDAIDDALAAWREADGG